MNTFSRLNNSGCGVWALVTLVALLLLSGLLVYVDQRFGAEASALLLGMSLGIPLLLIVVLIVGGIYVLVIRGTVHMQERDDRGEVERLRAFRELVRSEQTHARRDKAALDLARQEQKRLTQEEAKTKKPSPPRWSRADWQQAEAADRDGDGDGYWVVE